MSEKQKQPETCIMINDTSQHSAAMWFTDLDVVGHMTITLLQIYC